MRLLVRSLGKRCLLTHVHLSKGEDEAGAAGSHLAARRKGAHLSREPAQRGEPGMLRERLKSGII